ncbi:MAG: aliphatic nitrilase [Pseudonocardia sp. SCN 72-86]|nr:MAG: aliphatic nitrilase [Pseudonocardia sp. SCN 72-86]
MARKVRVAAVQLNPDLDTPTGTVDRVVAAIGDAAAQGAELVVFPETVVPYYPYFSFVQPPMMSGGEHMRLYENAVVVPGPVTDAVSAAARQHGVVVMLGVNERDHGSLYCTQLLWDADGSLVLHRRKTVPTFHERMIWGRGDGSGFKVVDTAVGRVGALACWENFNPLNRYALQAQHEDIHLAHFPGSLVGQLFADQVETLIRHQAAEGASFVVCATAWLTEEQIAKVSPDEGLRRGLRGGCMTAIISPEGQHIVPPITEGEGILVADLDMSLITKRKRMFDSVGHYSRPELVSLLLNDTKTSPVHRAYPTPKASAYEVESVDTGETNGSAPAAPETNGNGSKQTANA